MVGKAGFREGNKSERGKKLQPCQAPVLFAPFQDMCLKFSEQRQAGCPCVQQVKKSLRIF
jgi:hypothetical protein